MRVYLLCILNLVSIHVVVGMNRFSKQIVKNGQLLLAHDAIYLKELIVNEREGTSMDLSLRDAETTLKKFLRNDANKEGYTEEVVQFGQLIAQRTSDRCALMAALKNNDVDEVTALVQSNPYIVNAYDICFVPWDYITPLQEAVEWAPVSFEAVEKLISLGANYYKKSIMNKKSAVHFSETKAMTKVLVRRNTMCVNDKDDKGRSPLYYALFKSPDLARAFYLVKHGSSVDSCDNQENTLLHTAVRKNIVGWTKLLLEHNARVGMRNKEGKTAFDIALELNNEKMLQLFARHGLLFFSRADDSFSFVSRFLKKSAETIEDIQNNHSDHSMEFYRYKQRAHKVLTQLLVAVDVVERKKSKVPNSIPSNHGILINNQGVFFNQATMEDLVSWLGLNVINTAKVMIETKCQTLSRWVFWKNYTCLKRDVSLYSFVVPYVQSEAYAMLKRSIENDEYDSFQLLLECNPNLNCVDKQGNSLLHIAVLQNRKKFVTSLLSKDIDFTLCNENGKTAFDVAYQMSQRSPAILDVFYDKIIEQFVRVLPHMSWYKNAKLFFKKDTFNINKRERNTRETMLFVAIKNRCDWWTSFLLKNGAYVNIHDRDGKTPLSCAILPVPNASIISLLLRNGVLVDRHLIQYVNDDEHVSALLEKACDQHSLH